MMLSLSVPAFAAETTGADEDIAAIAEEYQVNVEEIENLSENLSDALSKVGYVSVDETVTVPVSENLSLTIEPAEMPSYCAVTPGYYTYGSTASIKNALGMTLIKLEATGLFLVRNGTCSADDAYGSYEAFVWNVSNDSTRLGPSGGYSSYVRVTFSGQLDLGIDPVSITLSTFAMSCTLYMNADLDASYRWTTQD